MRKRAFELNETEVKVLRQREQQTRDAYELKRLQAVRWYGTGMSIEAILKLITSSESSIRLWVQHYQANGVDGLRSKWQGNNAKKLSDEQREHLRQRLHEGGPQQWAISQGQFWTASDLEVAVQQWYGVSYSSPKSYVNLMHACGFSYQQAEKVYRSRSSERDIAEFEVQLEKKSRIFAKRTPTA